MRPRGLKIDEIDEYDENEINELREQHENALSNAKKRSLHFMIVDDTAPTRKLMRRMLMSAGHTVDEAVDGYT